jgi:hypothetical protein
MTKDEALKQGVEALENIDRWLPTIGQKGLRDYEADALAAMKEALAQPAQEPVAWMHPSGGVLQKLVTGLERSTYTIPLYAALPKREWVGLMDDEIDKWTPEIHVVIRSVEQLLRERNS